MQFVQVEDIIVKEGRMRKTFSDEELFKLRDSIRDTGLIYPLVVEEDGRTLIAGERRLRAFKLLYIFGEDDGACANYLGEPIPFNHVPVISTADLSSRQKREIEFHENYARVNLTWQEESIALAELYEYFKEGEDESSSTEIAEKIGVGKSSLYNAISMKPHLEDPDVAKAKTRAEAVKLIEKKKAREKRELLGREFNVESVRTRHVLELKDIHEAFKSLPDEKFSCIIADPPYGVGADEWNNMSATKHAYSDDFEYAWEIMQAIAKEGFRVTEKKAHLYLFHDIQHFPALRELFVNAGWKVFRTPFIWAKGSTVGVTPWPKTGPRRTYEPILYAVKGDREVNSIFPDLLDIRHESGVDRGAHKPVELYENLLKRTCYPGEFVLDPTCGTGPIFPAASRLGLIAHGYDIDPDAIAFSAKRLEESHEEPDLLEGF